MNYNVGKGCLNFSSDSKSLTFIIILTTTTVTIIKMPLRLTFFIKSLRVSANLPEEEMFVTLSNKQQKIVNQWWFENKAFMKSGEVEGLGKAYE